MSDVCYDRLLSSCSVGMGRMGECKSSGSNKDKEKNIGDGEIWHFCGGYNVLDVSVFMSVSALAITASLKLLNRISQSLVHSKGPVCIMHVTRKFCSLKFCWNFAPKIFLYCTTEASFQWNLSRPLVKRVTWLFLFALSFYENDQSHTRFTFNDKTEDIWVCSLSS